MLPALAGKFDPQRHFQDASARGFPGFHELFRPQQLR